MNYLVVLMILLSFFVTFFSTNYFIKYSHKKGEKFLTKDMYKKDQPHIPTMGGIPIFIGILVSLPLVFLAYSNHFEIFIFYLVLSFNALFGLVDDILFLKRRFKIIILYFLDLPISLIVKGNSLTAPLIGTIDGWVYCYIVAPVFIMIAANLINMLSGFNGLSIGLSCIILSVLVVKSFDVSTTNEAILILPIFVSATTFMAYNTYPSKIFAGNIGTHMLGAAIGGFIVLQNIEYYGTLVLAPHIVNFLLYAFWIVAGIHHAKFGKINEDGTLDVPNPLTLKWTFPYYFRLTEKQVIIILYSITLIFGLIVLVI